MGWLGEALGRKEGCEGHDEDECDCCCCFVSLLFSAEMSLSILLFFAPGVCQT